MHFRQNERWQRRWECLDRQYVRRSGALELLGIIKPVPGGGNYIADDLDSWLIGPLSILFKLNNSYFRQNQQLRAALEREMAILRQGNAHHLTLRNFSES